MSLNYKSALTSDNDGFIEVKKNKQSNVNNKSNVNSNSTINVKPSYDKEHLNEIINDTFELEYSGPIIEAKLDFEDILENEFYLKFKYPINSKSKSLHDIVKYHSNEYYKIKQDIHKNKSKYL